MLYHFNVNGQIIIRDCIFESIGGRDLVSYHNNKEDNSKSTLTISNNYFKGKGTFRLSWYGESTMVSTAKVYGNSFGTELIHRAETNDKNSSIKNTEIYEWNNEFRNIPTNNDYNAFDNYSLGIIGNQGDLRPMTDNRYHLSSIVSVNAGDIVSFTGGYEIQPLFSLMYGYEDKECKIPVCEILPCSIYTEQQIEIPEGVNYIIAWNDSNYCKNPHLRIVSKSHYINYQVNQ